MRQAQFMVFNDYADFYDLLYREKNYRQECEFVRLVFETYGHNKINSILDLGCGTGSHALPLADMGYQVTGVDLSEKMLQTARRKAAEPKKSISFFKGDIRHLDLGKRFDAALAMFTVMGYLTSNQDIKDAVCSIRRHLVPGGLFVFDVWFGPAVLKVRPEERTRVIRTGDREIARHARPVLDVLRHTIEVNYTVTEKKGNQHLSETKESHVMRFFFYQELLYFLEDNGFEVIKICPFMNFNGPLDEECWNITVIGRALE